MRNTKQRSGLILLVVLGMLSLFSMLAITYVVFSAQSRSANVAMARREFRGTPAPKLLDEAAAIALRGTTKTSSSLFEGDLLGDLYGHIEAPTVLRVRDQQVAISPGTPTDTVTTSAMNSSSLQAPVLLPGNFLRIPIAPVGGTVIDLPVEFDQYTSRVVTFLDGPLANISFRIVRSLGRVYSSAPPIQAQQVHSLIVDLGDIEDQLATATVTRASAVGVQTITKPISEWRDDDIYNLCFADANGAFSGGYQLLVNAAPLNAFGAGVTPKGQTQTVRLEAGLDDPGRASGSRGAFPLALQPNLGAIGHQPVLPLDSVSDSDESYDAADYKNTFLYQSLWPSSAGTPQSHDIIPSFHRAAIINYIVNESNPADYSDVNDLRGVVQRIIAATSRPLSVVINGTAIANPNFSGSNQGAFPPSVTAPRIPQLNIQFDSTEWGSGSAADGLPNFLHWVRMLTAGPWDVDNDGDGLNDSIWTDPEFPLITSPEGKLLKALVAYQIEALDGRLDMNAVGDIGQTYSTGTPYARTTTAAFAGGAGMGLTQGFGYGPGEMSIRHLFDTDLNYQGFLQSRYRRSSNLRPSNVDVAGRVGDDLRSILSTRETPVILAGASTSLTATNHNWRYRHGTLPALPLATRGRQALGFDLLGNPLLLNGSDYFAATPRPPFDEGLNSPYESSLLSGGPDDNPISFADWERIERQYDQDRSNMSRRLDGVFDINEIRRLTPRSRHLRHTSFASNRAGVQGQTSISFQRMLDAIGDLRSTQINVTPEMVSELFPLEFAKSEPLNLNRALGNGFDDDSDGQFDEPGELSARLVAGRPINESQQSVVSNNTTVSLSATLFDDYAPGVVRLDPVYESLTVGSPVYRRFYGLQSRQLLARHLYCLAMFILPLEIQLPNQPDGNTVTGPERAKLLAQWAVNAVDFRDADSAMTRFPYDPTPFASDGSGNFWTPMEIVWGSEQREAILTESLAFHDVRVRDTAEDTSTQRLNDDDDYDQLRIPEGSGFVEVRALRTTSTPDDQTVPGAASSMFIQHPTTGRVGLNLAAVTPANADGTVFPVFRIAVSQPHPGSGDTPADAMGDPATRNTLEYQFPNQVASTTPSTTTSTTNGLRWSTDSSVTAPEIDRLIWFTSSLTPTLQNIPDVRFPSDLDGLLDNSYAASRVYYNINDNNVVLEGGQHLVVGPRPVTYIGSKESAGAIADNPVNNPNNHRIELDGDWATVYSGTNNAAGQNAGGTARRTSLIMRTLTMVAATPAQWDSSVTPTSGDLPEQVGFNVSAPPPSLTEYYQTPTDQLNSDDDAGDSENGALGFQDLPADAYTDYNSAANQLIDAPFDGSNNEDFPLREGAWPLGEVNGVSTPGTATNWCTAYLQRLADPEKPWHSDFNPYITIDWIPFDLTVFSGEERITESATGDALEFNFASRQKTGLMIDRDDPMDPTAAAIGGQTFLSYWNEGRSTESSGRTADTYFTRELPIEFADPGSTDAIRPTTLVDHRMSLGYLNTSFRLRGEMDNTGGAAVPTVAAFLGAPSNVPSSMLWMNRQYTNPYELALVPISSPGQMLQDYFFPTSDNGESIYDEDNRSHYGYLLNWFEEPEAGNTTVTADTPVKKFVAPSSMFEFTTVPSPWADAAKHIPAGFVAGSVPLATMRAPYNKLSKFVEPGRVNVNAISHPYVWQGVMWNINPNAASRTAPTATPWGWNEYSNSLRGYVPAAGVISNGNPRLNPNSPTQFGGVFKSSFSAGFVPQVRTPLEAAAATNPINTTIARMSSDDKPLFADATAYSAAGTPRNPFRDFQHVARLANLVTTRSNVFAVRVTLGFFEFDPATGLGREYGEDEGRVKRHKAFYVMDRSIPVGYIPGEDLNTNDCIIVRRIIE